MKSLKIGLLYLCLLALAVVLFILAGLLCPDVADGLNAINNS
jgi:hypothetical protein